MAAVSVRRIVRPRSIRSRAARPARPRSSRLRGRRRSSVSAAVSARPPGSATTKPPSTSTAGRGASIDQAHHPPALAKRLVGDALQAGELTLDSVGLPPNDRVVGVEQHQPVDAELGHLLHHPVEPITLRHRRSNRDRPRSTRARSRSPRSPRAAGEFASTTATARHHRPRPSVTLTALAVSEAQHRCADGARCRRRSAWSPASPTSSPSTQHMRASSVRSAERSGGAISVASHALRRTPT